MGRGPEAPYIASPSSQKVEPHALSSPAPAAKASPVLRTRPGARVPVKGAPLHPVHTQVPGKLSEKLDAKRTAILASDTEVPAMT